MKTSEKIIPVRKEIIKITAYSSLVRIVIFVLLLSELSMLSSCIVGYRHGGRGRRHGMERH